MKDRLTREVLDELLDETGLLLDDDIHPSYDDLDFNDSIFLTNGHFDIVVNLKEGIVENIIEVVEDGDGGIFMEIDHSIKLKELINNYIKAIYKLKLNENDKFIRDIEEFCEVEIPENIHELLSDLKKDKPGMFEFEFSWDHNDGVDLNDFIDHPRVSYWDTDDSEIESYGGLYQYTFNRIWESIWGLNIEYIDEVEYAMCEEIYYELGLDDKDIELTFELREIISEYLDIDLNIDALFENTDLYINLIPLQGYNLNTEGQQLYQETLDMINDGKTDSVILNKLFESQGYMIEDMLNEEKVKNSKFLKSVSEEILNMPTYGTSFYTILVKTNGLEYLKMLDGAKTITVKPGVMSGFFSPSVGSGSILDIELEKDFTFDIKDMEIQIEGRRNNYGYTVDEIYSLSKSAWTNNWHYE